MWNVYDAFNKYGFDEGGSRRNYTENIADVIREVGYTVVSNDDHSIGSPAIHTITRISDGEVVYGVPNRLLFGYHHDRTIANTLPEDIARALWDFNNSCNIEGFRRLPNTHFFDPVDSDDSAEEEKEASGERCIVCGEPAGEEGLDTCDICGEGCCCECVYVSAGDEYYCPRHYVQE
jgi:hypothetical protein